MRPADADDLRPTETDLVGQLLDTGNRIERDAVSARIEWLVSERLERVAVDPSGRGALFRDPHDGRLWELTYPHSHWPGGGPPRLTVVTAEAAAKYRVGGAD